ncbi:hypothetical protein KQX54_015979 [Cotesia glomerata]|uniref:Uncharacterized protein n=1 Tax=Cotesia glomerata TaxID=32391 RepID=A0AAV7IYW6_COTGL|nr:hypothetical protein KQX54_015979 [Cotesia glomerata]
MFSLVFWNSKKNSSVIETKDIKNDDERGPVARRGKNYFPIKIIKQSKFKNVLEKIDVDHTGTIIEKPKRKYLKKSKRTESKNKADLAVVESKSIFQIMPVPVEKPSNEIKTLPRKIEEKTIQQHITLVGSKKNEESGEHENDKILELSNNEDNNFAKTSKGKRKRVYMQLIDSEDDDSCDDDKTDKVEDNGIEKASKKNTQSAPRNLFKKIDNLDSNTDSESLPSCSTESLTDIIPNISTQNSTWPVVSAEYKNFLECYLRHVKSLYAQQQQDPTKVMTEMNVDPKVCRRQYKKEVMPGSKIFVGTTFLEHLTSKKMRRDPNEMTRSLLKKIIGEEELTNIATTKKNERNKLPQNTYNTVKGL